MLTTEVKKNIYVLILLCISSLHSFGSLKYGPLLSRSIWFPFPHLSVWNGYFYINCRTFFVSVWSNSKFIVQVQNLYFDFISRTPDTTWLLQRYTRNGNSTNEPPLSVFFSLSLFLKSAYVYYSDDESNLYIALGLMIIITIPRNILSHSPMSSGD